MERLAIDITQNDKGSPTLLWLLVFHEGETFPRESHCVGSVKMPKYVVERFLHLC